MSNRQNDDLGERSNQSMNDTNRHPAEKAYDEVLDELADCGGFPMAEGAALRMRNRWMNTEAGQNG